MITIPRREVLQLTGAALVGLGLGAGTATAHEDGKATGALERQLAGVRAATAAFRNPEVAEDAGYAPITPFVCGMGHHWGNATEIARLTSGGTVDPLTPPVINYGETANGNLVLGAVEYFAPMERFGEDEDLVTHYEDAPDLFRDENTDSSHPEEWEVLPADVSGLPVDVWALHAWVHMNNPDGVFAHTNSRKQFTADDCVELGE